MDGIEFRRAVPDDAHAVATYHERCFEKTYAAQLSAGELRTPDFDGTMQQLLGWFQPGAGLHTRVAVRRGVPIAHFTVQDHQLVHLFVEPGHHGIGLGGVMLAQGEAMIAAGGHQEFELHARVDNLNAISFYQAAGWTVTDRRLHTDEHGISYDEHVLIKRCQ